MKVETERSGMAGQLLVDSLRTALAIHLLRKYCTTHPKLSSDSNGLSQSSLKQVIEYIHQDLRLVQLSAIAQISSYHQRNG
ncbi:hypothetical protein [Phormidesmis priestleyi]|nr:hypothetical protein [Phormidesmis priestleyi]